MTFQVRMGLPGSVISVQSTSCGCAAGAWRIRQKFVESPEKLQLLNHLCQICQCHVVCPGREVMSNVRDPHVLDNYCKERNERLEDDNYFIKKLTSIKRPICKVIERS